MDRATYLRARAAGIPARNAAAIARMERPERWPLSWAEDGFDLRASDEADPYPESIGYGTFVDTAEDWRTGYHPKPSPDAVPNPRAGDGRAWASQRWYLPETSIREHAAEYRRLGYARGPAWDEARAVIAAELSRITDYGPDYRAVTVTVSRNGIDLASQSIYGVEVAWDPITRTSGEDYLAEVARDIAPEALAEARDALAALVATA